MIEIQTTIHRGFPVVARGRYVKGFPGTWDDPPEPEMIEDIAVYYPRGKNGKLRPCPWDLTDAEIDRIEREMLDANREDKYFRRYDG